MLDALEDFRKAHRLPPLLWVDQGLGAAGDLHGFGKRDSCRAWAGALELEEASSGRQSRWTGVLGASRITIRTY
jgi:hypothetical protein